MKTLVVAAALLLAAPAAQAGEGGGGGVDFMHGRFLITDADNNDYIDHEEAKSRYSEGLFEVFDLVDKDKDGRVYYPEFQDFMVLPICVLRKDCRD
ncbi:MAG: hypothetical protein ACREUA_11000 [Burkholderiales bacterium]